MPVEYREMRIVPAVIDISHRTHGSSSYLGVLRLLRGTGGTKFRTGIWRGFVGVSWFVRRQVMLICFRNCIFCTLEKLHRFEIVLANSLG